MSQRIVQDIACTLEHKQGAVRAARFNGRSQNKYIRLIRLLMVSADMRIVAIQSMRINAIH